MPKVDLITGIKCILYIDTAASERASEEALEGRCSTERAETAASGPVQKGATSAIFWASRSRRPGPCRTPKNHRRGVSVYTAFTTQTAEVCGPQTTPA